MPVLTEHRPGRARAGAIGIAVSGFAAQLCWRRLFLGFLRFFGLALLSFSHDRSPGSEKMYKKNTVLLDKDFSMTSG